MTAVENKNVGTGSVPCTNNISPQPVMEAGYVKYLKMDGKLSDPSWCNAQAINLSRQNCTFFKMAIAAGLKINENTLGLGKVQLITAESFYELDIKTIKTEPDILLYNDPKCRFYSWANMNLSRLNQVAVINHLGRVKKINKEYLNVI